jgi:hypothetical protein
MRAGTGISHSEYNASQTDSVHFLQIWVLPDANGLELGYEQRSFDLEKDRGKWVHVVAPHGRDGTVAVHQDIELLLAILSGTAGQLSPQAGSSGLAAGRSRRCVSQWNNAECRWRRGYQRSWNGGNKESGSRWNSPVRSCLIINIVRSAASRYEEKTSRLCRLWAAELLGSFALGSSDEQRIERRHTGTRPVPLENFIREASNHRHGVLSHLGDGKLKVYGIENLRIADGSIMPRVTTGNTMAPCVVIGERAGEILKAKHKL